MPKNSLSPLKHTGRERICIGPAAEILTPSVQDQLRRLQKEIGYRHIRFHGSFHDELGVVGYNGNGSVRYHWAWIDQTYDFLVEIGFDPIVS
jgi:xylan 1,4-beta-xylosidase